MIINTIGTQAHNAQSFFDLLEQHSIERVIDIRRRNTAQVCGVFTKANLAYLVPLIAPACLSSRRTYEHRLDLAPPMELLAAWHRKEIKWDVYTRRMERHLLDANPVYYEMDTQNAFRERRTVLLCSEHKPEHCHRSIVAEWVQRTCPHKVEIVNL